AGGDLPVAERGRVAPPVSRTARTRRPGSGRHRPLPASALRRAGHRHGPGGARQAGRQRTAVRLMNDRHFDELATRFAEKIYGGAKGAIRLAVLQADLAEVLP